MNINTELPQIHEDIPTADRVTDEIMEIAKIAETYSPGQEELAAEYLIEDPVRATEFAVQLMERYQEGEDTIDLKLQMGALMEALAEKAGEARGIAQQTSDEYAEYKNQYTWEDTEKAPLEW